MHDQRKTMKNMIAFLVFLGAIHISYSVEGPVKIKWGLADSGAVVGRVFTYIIPSDAFSGNVESYEVSDAAGGRLPSWLYFDGEEEELAGVPGEEDLGPHNIMVTAVGGLNTTHASVSRDVFTIHVRQEKAPTGKIRTLLDREGSVGMEAVCEKDEPALSVSLQMDLEMDSLDAKAKREFLENAGRILDIDVRRLRLLSRDYSQSLNQFSLMAGPGQISESRRPGGAFISWRIGCGSSMSQELKSEVEAIERGSADGTLYAGLGYVVLSWQVSSGYGRTQKRRRQASFITPTPTLNPTPYTAYTQPETRPLRTSETTWPQTTQTRTEPRRTTTTVTRTTTSTTPPLPITRKPEDARPELRNHVPTQTCKQSRLCKFKLPNDVFYDQEDGTNLDLSLAMMTESEDSKDDIGFLTFGKRKMYIQGISLKSGDFKFQLTATDSGGQEISNVFHVTMEAEKIDNPSHKFSVTLKEDFDKFVRSPNDQVSLLRKIAKHVGDSDSSSISLLSIEKGSTIVSWFNNTFPTDNCSEEELQKLRRKFIRRKGQPSKALKGKLRPFKAIAASFEYRGVCLEQKGSEPAKGDEEGKNSVEPSAAGVDSHFVATILPIIIIAVLLITALLIACFLYRRNRKAQAAKQEVKSLFVSKGAPIIFPDEVEPGEREPLPTSPLLIKEERAPLQPPEMGRNGSHSKSASQPRPTEAHEMQETHPQSTFQGGRGSTPRMTTTENPLYKPPPPIGELGPTRSPRPKHTLPHQREPPPYVPP